VCTVLNVRGANQRSAAAVGDLVFMRPPRIVAMVITLLLALAGCSGSARVANPGVPASAIIERPDEMLPGTEMGSADIRDVLSLYSELTGANLDVEDGVRHLHARVSFKRTYPAMTRAQAIEMIDTALLQAGVVVTHPDIKHVIFRLKR
jgi:hypothetical protein